MFIGMRMGLEPVGVYDGIWYSLASKLAAGMSCCGSKPGG